jgi:hypothetical protein
MNIKEVVCAQMDWIHLAQVMVQSRALLAFLVEWKTLVLRILYVPGSNLSPETGYSD